MVKNREWLNHLMAHVTVLFLLVLFATVYFSPRIFIRIPSGHMGVLYRVFLGGTVVDRVYHEGLSIVCPWDRMYLYDVRRQTKFEQFTVLSQEGLNIQVDVAVRYRPEAQLLGMLHQRIGTNYYATVVLSEVAQAVRSKLADFSITEVYTTPPAVLSHMLRESVHQVVEHYVVVEDLLVTRVQLPNAVAEAIIEKIRQEQLALSYQYRIEQARQEAVRLNIEANGLSQYNQIVNASITPSILRWKGIEATKAIATATNSKVVIMGNSAGSLPVILNAEGAAVSKGGP